MHWKRFSLLLALAFLIHLPSAHAIVVAKTADSHTSTVEAAAKKARADLKKMDRKERRAYKKALRSKAKDEIRAWKERGADDTNTLLLVLVTILLPPVGMILYEGGLTDRFWISLLLTLLFYLPGLIYTLIIILGEK